MAVMHGLYAIVCMPYQHRYCCSVRLAPQWWIDWLVGKMHTQNFASSWALLQVANVGTHQLLQQMSRNTCKKQVGKKINVTYDIPYIDKINVQKYYWFAWVQLQLLENYYPNCSFLNTPNPPRQSRYAATQLTCLPVHAPDALCMLIYQLSLFFI